MKLSDFDYHLPKELIAQYPLEERDQAKLLVLERKTGKIHHLTFKDITDFIKEPDLLVLNNTKVVCCRILANRSTGGKVEIFLLKHQGGLLFEVMLKPGRLKINEKITFKTSPVYAIITGKDQVKFYADNLEQVYALGQIPLPPYIKRVPTEQDKIFYQTVYARVEGSVASPTAGLHFTPQLLEKLRSQGVASAELTLHVGLATFKAVEAEVITDHVMGSEYFQINDPTADAINKTRRSAGRIVAVGTTSCRSLETYALGQRSGYTDIFIYPGYKFKLTDCLVTNFHLPKTTLFMLVCAFAGTDLAKKAYAQAVQDKYRFYSYGDAMLIV